jgi:hypothetical protein
MVVAQFLHARDSNDFDHYFNNQTLRIDYYHTGDASDELFTLDEIYLQGPWAGNPSYCIQPFELGTYKVCIYDLATNKVIYTKGYNSIFAEYQTTGPALKGEKTTMHESVLVPRPKNPFRLIIEKRNKQNILFPVYTLKIDPADYHINTESYKKKEVEVVTVVNNGNPANCVDLVILAEGYQADEKGKFMNDLHYYTGLLFSTEPYKSRKQLFNISGVFVPADESGTDEPRQGIYKNTPFNSSFNALELDRYCLAQDNKSIRDAAASVPYDVILIMVNKDRYGGGGIYNWQTVFCTGSPWRDYVFLHEFGHGFAGLGDEYYGSPVTYEDFYTPGVEPLEANITALPDPDNVKWKQYLSPGIAVPTEWGKATYDSMNNEAAKIRGEMGKTLDSLRKSSASADVVRKVETDFQVKLDRINREITDFVDNHPLKDKVGVFEGANYMTKGLYRPTIMSLMHRFSENDRSYGFVNEQAIISVIRYYTDK